IFEKLIYICVIDYIKQNIMMKIDFRYASHPVDARSYGTDELRSHFLLDPIFSADQIHLTYSMYDLYIDGVVMSLNKALKLETIDHLKSSYFEKRRELGDSKVGGSATVKVDGEVFSLEKKEALYNTKESKEVSFKSNRDEQA